MHARPSRADAELEARTGRGVVVHRHVEVERPGLDPHVVDHQIDRRVGHGERVEGGMQRGLRSILGCRRESEVRELAVLEDDAYVRFVHLDLVDGELAGQQREQLRSDPSARALEQRGPSVVRLQAYVRQLDRQRPHVERHPVARDDALIAQDSLGLARGPRPRPRGPDRQRRREGQQAHERQDDAQDPRDPPPPVETLATTACSEQRRLARLGRAGGLGVGRRHEP